jgi:hypothetical protein
MKYEAQVLGSQEKDGCYLGQASEIIHYISLLGAYGRSDFYHNHNYNKKG